MLKGLDPPLCIPGHPDCDRAELEEVVQKCEHHVVLIGVVAVERAV